MKKINFTNYLLHHNSILCKENIDPPLLTAPKNQKPLKNPSPKTKRPSSLLPSGHLHVYEDTEAIAPPPSTPSPAYLADF